MKIDKFLLDSELELGILNSVSDLITWDQYTIAPDATSERKAKESEYFAGLIHNILTDDKYIEKINKLSRSKNLSLHEKAIIRLRKKNIEKLTRLPLKFLQEQETVKSLAIPAWEKARDENKFSIFAPHLEKLIDFQIKEAKYVDQDVYSCALSNFDETLTSTEIEELLSSLKESLIPLIDVFKSKEKKLDKHTLYPKYKQKLLAKYLLNLIGVDAETIISETTHPFQSTLSYKDNRIATLYKENDVIFCIGTVLHEGGHAIYQQGIPKNINNTILADAPGMSLHESQSRLYETIIGQSYPFIKLYFPKLKELFGDQFKYISHDEFYFKVNKVRPSLIRINSDELTYCLHIIIRFELEKRLLDKSLKVKDLPVEWNRLYKKYLGVTPTNMKNGVLQDIHWGDGSFGYFPSYAVGNVLAGMFADLLKKELKTINKKSIISIRNKLHSLLHRHGAVYESKDMIKKIFGNQHIDVKPYVAYLTNKYYG